VVKEALKLIRASLPTTIEIRQSLEASGRIIEADPTQIHQVLMNLCTNALHAMEHTGGILEVGLRSYDLNEREPGQYGYLEPGPYLSLEVHDTGAGIADHVLDRIFEPFFTTKGPGEGTGMGLAVVHGIVRSHGGTIKVRSNPGEGTTFQVLLPCVKGEAKRERETTEVFPSGKERILFIDDEASLNNLGKEMLERLGYEVEPWTSPLDALEAFRARPGEFQLVITDKTMPQMTGFRLAEQVKRIRRDVPIILCTGFGNSQDVEQAEAMGISRTLMKPLSMRSLAMAVREVLDGDSSSQEDRASPP
jgi:CheY-like chemotaxis protein